MDNKHKIAEFIEAAEAEGLENIRFESFKFNNIPWYKIYFKYHEQKGSYDVSEHAFNRVDINIIIKEILRGFIKPWIKWKY